MKKLFDPSCLPRDSVLITCSSHEERCLALPNRWGKWRPRRTILFHYDDSNARRERNHAELRRLYDAGSSLGEVGFTESNAVESFHQNRATLVGMLEEFSAAAIVFDLTVFTKRHLLMMLRWLDDANCFGRVFCIYSEPDKYEVSKYIPLSFGVAKVEEVPGFPAAPDASRPVHVVIFLGFEGDRTLATYEILQPGQTTLITPDPPYREAWRGMSEELNRDLIAVVGKNAIRRVDALDPELTRFILREILGEENRRGDVAKVICPLGTKPQTLGTYLYARAALDPPAIVYTGPLRHNHAHFSSGIGKTWLVLEPST